jgi:hypothetical protein
MTNDAENLTAAVQRLAALLGDPHPGLATWQEAVQRLRQEIGLPTPRTRTSLLDYALGEIHRAVGRRYPLLEQGLELLAPAAQGEFKRLLDDLASEAHAKERRAAREPWRFMGR